MKLEQLKSAHAEKISAAKAIKDAAETAGRSVTEAELTQIKAMRDEIDTLKAQISAAEEARDLLGDIDAMAADVVKPIRQTVQHGQIKSRELVQDDPMKGFENTGQLLKAVMDYGRTGRVPANAPGLHYLIPKSTAGSDEHSGSDDARGGVMIPKGMAPGLLSVGSEGNPLAALTRKVTSDTPKIEFVARVDNNQSGGSVTGGFKFYRKAEAAEATSSRTSFRGTELQAHTLIGLAYATNEILEDSATSFSQLIGSSFAEEYNNKTLNEMIRGTGVGEYLGVLNSGALVTVAKETAQGGDTINVSNIYRMRSRSWNYMNSVWVANPDTLPQLLALRDGDTKLWQQSLLDDRPETLMGRPIYYLDACSTLGDVGDIMLLNLGEYLEMLYKPLMGESSIHVRFVEHETAFRFVARTGGRPWWNAPLTPKNSSVTRSPFVTLAERAGS